MTSLNRPLAGETIVFDLAREIETTRNAHSPEQAGRTARTLLKDGPLRVTLILLQAGARIAEHGADGPITIQVLSGSIRLSVGDRELTLDAGQLVGAGAGVRHAVAANEDAAFLLTVVLPGTGD